MVAGLFPMANLIARLGAIKACRPSGSYEYFQDRNPCGLKVDLAFRIDRPPEAPVFVTLWFWAVSRSGNVWETTEYSMHFGPQPRGPYYLRVCDNPTQQPAHHFHHHRWPTAYDGGHIPADRSNPRIPTKADLGWFMDMLEAFLNTGQVPIEVIL